MPNINTMNIMGFFNKKEKVKFNVNQLQEVFYP